MISQTRSRVAIGTALLTATFFLLSVGSAPAQSSRAKATIPFAFYWGEGMLPAGDYDVKSLGNGIAGLFNRNTHTSAAFMTVGVSSPTGEPVNGKLIFHRYGEDYFLSEMWWEGQSVGSRLLPSKAERELARGVGPARIAVAVR